MQKFVPRSSVGNFRNEHTRSTPLDPKHTYWCVSYYLGAFGTLRLPYRTRCKTGRTSAKVRAMKTRRNFSQRTHTIHLIGHYTDVLMRSLHLGAFDTVWLPYGTWCKTGRTSAKVRSTKSHRNFSRRSHPIHPIGP